jgi:cell division septation protein DedD
MNRTLVVALSVAMAAGRPPALPGQDSVAVRVAARLVAEGRSDSARVLLNGVLSRTKPGDTTYIQALYWRSRAATYADSAERDLRRVALEFSTSAWADSALLQLSQLALAAGNPASSVELAARLRSDYPTSRLRASAALWAGRAAFEVGQPRTACALLDSARTEGAADVEFTNQVAFYRSRCTAQLLAPPPTAPASDTASRAGGPGAEPAQGAAPSAAGTAPKAPPSDRVGAPHWEVQAAAASSDAAARDLVRRLARAGLRARVLPGDRHRRVRLGPFATREEAEAAARAARRIVGGAPFVVSVP